MTRLNEEEAQGLVSLYKTGKSCRFLSNKFKISRHSISKILKKHNIVVSRFKYDTMINDKKYIIESYLKGKSTIKIAKELKSDKETICKTLKRNNINLRSMADRSRKFKINEFYFNEIDTQDKAYILGLLYSDGCIHGNMIKISLNNKDSELLEKVSNKIYLCNKPLYFNKSMCELIFHSKIVANKLYEYGCTPKKSLSLNFPEHLPIELLPHFIRGFFDGDGSVHLRRYKLGKKALRVTFTSTLSFCLNLQIIFKEILNVDSIIYADKNCEKNGNIITKNLHVGKKDHAFKLLSWLYESATLYMKRKYILFKEYKVFAENYSEPPPKKCIICGGAYHSKGLCKKHYYHNRYIKFRHR